LAAFASAVANAEGLRSGFSSVKGARGGASRSRWRKWWLVLQPHGSWRGINELASWRGINELASW